MSFFGENHFQIGLLLFTMPWSTLAPAWQETCISDLQKPCSCPGFSQIRVRLCLWHLDNFCKYTGSIARGILCWEAEDRRHMGKTRGRFYVAPLISINRKGALLQLQSLSWERVIFQWNGEFRGCYSILQLNPVGRISNITSTFPFSITHIKPKSTWPFEFIISYLEYEEYFPFL